MSSEQFAERILRFIGAGSYEPLKAAQIAEALGIGDDEMGDFHDACRALMKTGRVVAGARDALLPASPRGTITGKFRRNPRGFGFVIPDLLTAHGDLYVPDAARGDAITGDHVLAEVRKRGKRDGRMLQEGRIVRVLKRGQSRFTGELCRQFSRWLVVPDGNTLHAPIAVGDPGAKGAKAGDHVVIEMLKYPTSGVEARGVIVKVLGRSGDPDVDTRAIIEQHQLPGEFPTAVTEEAGAIAESFDHNAAAAGREDLTKETVITIDPVDARDFDDAISLKRLDDDRVELGVHIADVSCFVREGSPLDGEARTRANSVYLPRWVIPMLPEVLSNGLCSLQEREARLTKSAFITYDARGRVVDARFANSVIKSAKRLTYEQASAILDGQRGRMSAKVVALLTEMDQLARRIRARRLREGMLVLEMPDVDLVFDDNGSVTDARPADTSFSHTIIEMFMVEANEAVSRLLTGLNVPHLRRVHGPPAKLVDGTLHKFLAALGYKLDESADRAALQKLLAEVHGKPEAFAVNLAVLRSMQQAEYSPELIGHFALASEHYAHFTSPIRRYPDLTVHRLLDKYLRGELGESSPSPRRRRRTPVPGPSAERGGVPTAADLVELGDHCSESERRAEAAERELQMVLVLRLLEKKLGEVFDGVVTGIANVGAFVQLDRYLIDGLLRFDSLPDDWWQVDATRGFVIGERSGRRICVGDRLKVAIARISIPMRQLDLVLAQTLPPPPRRSDGDGTSRGRGKDRRQDSRKPKAFARGRARGRGKSSGSRGRRN